MKFSLSLPGPVLRFFRRLFMRTPPQRESGWVRVSRTVPTKLDANWNGLIEVYFSADDSIAQAYFWSFTDMPVKLRRNYYWRPLDSALPVDRNYAYFVRSRSVFG